MTVASSQTARQAGDRPTPERETFLALFSRIQAQDNDPYGSAGVPPAYPPQAGELRQLRQAAMQQFVDLGFPTTRDEEWRYTSVAAIAREPFILAEETPEVRLQPEEVQDLEARYFGTLPSPLLVFVDGQFSSTLSSRKEPVNGVVVSSLAAALKSQPELVEQYLVNLSGTDHPFTALNTAFLQDGAFIHIARGKALEQPIRLLFVSTSLDEPTVSHPRTLVVAEEGSQASVVEAYIGMGDAPTFTNAVTEIVVGENAVVDHCKIQQDGAVSFHVASLYTRHARSSTFSSHSFSLGGAIVRNDIRAYLGGEGIEATFNGLYMARGREHVDNHTAIDHAMPHCNSREVYHGILDGSSTGVFNGKIFVRQDAQKTDARQTNRNLLLSEGATIDTKPQLEIFADDVKCTHGATVGQLDDDAIFYLRARGIPKQEATSLLTYAFASEIVGQVKAEPVRKCLEKLVFDWLSRKKPAVDPTGDLQEDES